MKFVDFSHSLINKPLAKQALAQLQSHASININLVLYTLWYGVSQRGRLLQEDIKIIVQSIHPWHERILLALKRLAVLNHPVIQKELITEITIAEQFERQLIADSLFKLNFKKRNMTQRINDACYNIINYYKTIRSPIHSDEQNAVIMLLQAASPQVITTKVTKISENFFNHISSEKHKSFYQLSMEGL